MDDPLSDLRANRDALLAVPDSDDIILHFGAGECVIAEPPFIGSITQAERFSSSLMAMATARVRMSLNFEAKTPRPATVTEAKKEALRPVLRAIALLEARQRGKEG
jgi:hypothetical protein